MVAVVLPEKVLTCAFAFASVQVRVCVCLCVCVCVCLCVCVMPIVYLQAPPSPFPPPTHYDSLTHALSRTNSKKNSLTQAGTNVSAGGLSPFGRAATGLHS